MPKGGYYVEMSHLITNLRCHVYVSLSFMRTKTIRGRLNEKI